MISFIWKRSHLCVDVSWSLHDGLHNAHTICILRASVKYRDMSIYNIQNPIFSNVSALRREWLSYKRLEKDAGKTKERDSEI